MEHRHPASLLESVRPFHLLTAFLTYGLGGGIARHLGWDINPGVFTLGALWLISLQLGYFFLGDGLRLPMLVGLIGHFRIIQEHLAGPGERERTEPLEAELLRMIGMAFFLLAAATTTWLGWLGWLDSISLIVLSLTAGGFLILLIPTLQGSLWSLREVVFALLHVVLPAGLAFVLQTGEYHRFLALSTFPLFGLHLALLLILQLISFRQDLRARYPTLLTGIGWVQGINLHNYLVIAAFFLMALAMFFDFPAAVILPAMSAVLPAGYLVWYLSRLQQGAATRWVLITALSLAGLFLPVYFLLFSFWLD
jgi:1,4-dihydroxy-2-naphthoate octaprenyltransferase